VSEASFDLVELLAMGLCAKTAIKNGGAGHGCWWELGTESKDCFRWVARALLGEAIERGITSLPAPPVECKSEKPDPLGYRLDGTQNWQP
jgi:hypothetical protein